MASKPSLHIIETLILILDIFMYLFPNIDYTLCLFALILIMHGNTNTIIRRPRSI